VNEQLQEVYHYRISLTDPVAHISPDEVFGKDTRASAAPCFIASFCRGGRIVYGLGAAIAWLRVGMAFDSARSNGLPSERVRYDR
jgi:hypothetical protein